MDGKATDPGGSRGDPPDNKMAVRFSRRALLGGISTGAAAGTATWIAPEIFITKPAAGATLSGPPVGLGGGVVGGPTSSPNTATVASNSQQSAGTNPGFLAGLANTGLDLERDAEVGVALVGAGWAMQYWASRRPQQAAETGSETPEAGSGGKPA
jgi:hypothetical protein